MEDFVAKQLEYVTFRDVEWNMFVFTGDVFNWQKPDTNGNICFVALFPVTMIESSV